MQRLPDEAAMRSRATLPHRQEVLRLRKPESVAVLDTGPEPAFDALVRCAARLAAADGVAVSDPAERIVLANRQWYALLAAAQRLPGRTSSSPNWPAAARPRSCRA
jgi:hypothetical protein